MMIRPYVSSSSMNSSNYFGVMRSKNVPQSVSQCEELCRRDSEFDDDLVHGQQIHRAGMWHRRKLIENALALWSKTGRQIHHSWRSLWMSLRLVLLFGLNTWRGICSRTGTVTKQRVTWTTPCPIVAAAVEDGAAIFTTKEFNIVLGTTLAISLVFLFLSAIFGDTFVNLVLTKMAIPVSAFLFGNATRFLTKPPATLVSPLKLGRMKYWQPRMNGTQPTTLWNTRCRLRKEAQHQTASSVLQFGAPASPMA